MDERSLDIIYLCKWYGNEAPEQIARYMGATCNYPYKEYTHAMLTSIVKEAYLDCIRHVPVSSVAQLVRTFLEADNESDLRRIMMAFWYLRVRDEYGSYVEGLGPPSPHLDNFRPSSF